MILQWIKKVWEFINKLHPQTRSLIIILLFGYILYSQITESTKQYIRERFDEEVLNNKLAEHYSMETSKELCNLVQLIAEKDTEAFDVLLLNYHNNTQSLQGYKYLYLSCLVEAPRSVDTPLLKLLWNKIDYIYYADELSKIHSQKYVHIDNVANMETTLPKLCRLVKASDAESVSFFTIEGHDSEIGMVVIFYNQYKPYDLNYTKRIMPHILKLAVLLDYENSRKK